MSAGLRDSTELASPAGQEFKNRLRGGGGGDLPAGGQVTIRRENKKGSASEKEELTADDDRDPLHTGGLTGHLG